jgi:AcrR family transcriptional regulator
MVAKVQIAERGYSDTSMRDIAEASGLLAGSLYSHFRSKAALVGDIVIGFYDELIPAQRAIVESDATGAEQLREMISTVYAICVTHREELTILHYDWHSLSMLDELSDVHALSLETLDLWQATVDKGKADRSLQPTVDSKAMVRIATSSIHALIDTVRYGSHPLPASQSQELVASLQDVLLGGVATDRPPPHAPPAAPKQAPARKSTAKAVTKKPASKKPSAKSVAASNGRRPARTTKRDSA